MQGGRISKSSNSFCGLLFGELNRLLNYNETKGAEEVGGHHHRVFIRIEDYRRWGWKISGWSFLKSNA